MKDIAMSVRLKGVETQKKPSLIWLTILLLNRKVKMLCNCLHMRAGMVVKHIASAHIFLLSISPRLHEFRRGFPKLVSGRFSLSQSLLATGGKKDVLYLFLDTLSSSSSSSSTMSFSESNSTEPTSSSGGKN